jgi:hypothetical protein
MGRIGAFIKFLALVSEAIFLQFIHVVGLLGFVAAAALGWYRKPSWLVPLLAVALGVLSDKFFSGDVAGLLEKAHKAEERGGFMVVVYFVICAVGYIAGAFGRAHFFNNAQPLPLAKPDLKLRKRK